MDFEFTGEETPEQLEKMLEGLGDVDIDSHAQDVVTEDTTEKHADEEAQTQTGDNNVAPAPDASVEQTQDVKEPEAKGVLTRDGKHVIPYEVLEAERSGKQRAEQEAALLRGQIAEEKRRVELLTSQIHQAGMKPTPLPENEKFLMSRLPVSGRCIRKLVTRWLRSSVKITISSPVFSNQHSRQKVMVVRIYHRFLMR
ncbi:hypothetical protein EC970259_1507 [Escherichia coli 99.0741]|nr:hypothetical protein EC970259_1507 [Escherichia coli 99.0741]